MRLIGLEPTRLTTPDPKSGAATNYATGAERNCFPLAGTKIGQVFETTKYCAQFFKASLNSSRFRSIL